MSKNNSVDDWNKDEFNLKIINPELFSPLIGDESGTHRNFDWEKSLVEYDPVKNDAKMWLGAADKRWFQKFSLLMKRGKIIQQFKQPIPQFPNYTFPEGSTPEFFVVGQSHLDLGYRWRYLQSTEKVKVTTSKACYHIENIPEYTFTVSQPVMLEWTLHKYPDLFKRIQEAVKTGRLELAGGSYCEPDTHLPSGESWCRQRLYGQLFYKKYFDKYAETEFIQDSFGFTSTLPQFLAKSAGKYFYTKKLNWNDTTVFPFMNFWWQSLDGSRILAHSLSGYHRKKVLNNWAKFAPTALLLKPNLKNNTEVFNYESDNLEGFLSGKTPEIFSEERLPYQIDLYGFGDGGHGPRGLETQLHLSLHKRDILHLGTLGDYFTKVESEFGDRLPVWKDELYFEYHRGTMTASPIIKRMNRYFEWTLPAAEKLAITVKEMTGAEFPQPAFDELWKFTLLQQFHDVLPGSHPPEMLDDCWAVWGTQKEKLSNIYTYLWSQILEHVPIEIPEAIINKFVPDSRIYPIILFNPSSFQLDSRIEIPLDQFPKEYSPDSWEIRTFNGVLLPTTLLSDSDLNHIHYNLPARVSFSMPNLIPNGFSICYLIQRTTIQEVEDSKIKIQESLDNIQVQSSCLTLSFDKNTGGCISLQFKTREKWIETLSSGKKRIKSDYPFLKPGILPQAFYEYSGVYALWDLFPKSRYYPYPISCNGISVNQENPSMCSIEIIFELRTPPASKIGNTKKVGVFGDNADQTGRRDPDVQPEFNLADFTDVSRFALIYQIYTDDPKVYLTVKSDFHAQETLVKLDIPTSTNATRLTTEVAYGIENRSTVPTTSRDKARWENLMHTWVNLQSDSKGWGFAILNNGKYGIDTHKGYCGITLVRGKKYPKPFFNILRKSWLGYERKKREKAGLGKPPEYASQGEHLWQFILYPHKGTPEKAKVLEHAHLFNSPVLTHVFHKHQDRIESPPSDILKKPILPTADIPLEVSAVKLAHPDNGTPWFEIRKKSEPPLIVRVVNWSDAIVDSSVQMNQLKVHKICECDLLEREIESDFEEIRDGKNIAAISTKWKPFEVKTFAILLD